MTQKFERYRGRRALSALRWKGGSERRARILLGWRKNQNFKTLNPKIRYKIIKFRQFKFALNFSSPNNNIDFVRLLSDRFGDVVRGWRRLDPDESGRVTWPEFATAFKKEGRRKKSYRRESTKMTKIASKFIIFCQNSSKIDRKSVCIRSCEVRF